MSTIINSISLCNFYNYYGDYDKNTYEFNSGLNVIVADNGAGKSKLFNGFLWILKDQVIDSDETDRIKKVVPIENKNSYMINMISDKEKNEIDFDEEIKCGVKLSFSDDYYEYEIEKSFYAIRISKGVITDANNWDYGLNEPIVIRRDKLLLDTVTILDKSEKRQIIAKVILPKFWKYALLQGEEVDNILDFNNKESLKDAIDTLSSVNKVDTLTELTHKLLGKASDDLTKERKKVVKNEKEYDHLVQKRKEIEKSIEQNKRTLNRTTENLNKAKDERDALFNFIKNAQKRQQVRSEIDEINRNLRKLDKEHSDFLNSLNDNFFDEQSAWLLYHTGSYGEEFIEIKEQYLAQRNEKTLLHNIKQGDTSFFLKLPEGSPDSYSLKKMLEDEKCYVCGQDAFKDSKEWKHIENVLTAHTKPKKKTSLTTKQDFVGLLNRLQMESQAFYNQIERVWEEVLDARRKDIGYRDEKKELIRRRSECENELSGLGGSGQIEDDQKINQFAASQQRIDRFDSEINTCRSEISWLERELITTRKKEESLANSDKLSKWISRQDMIIDMHNIAVGARKRIYDRTIKKLEDRSNFFYANLIKDNQSNGGRIRIVRESEYSYSIEIRDVQGNKIFGLSEGFQRMKKLAVIMGIIEIGNQGRMMNYPLIADAPISAFGKSFMKGFFDQVPKVFNQSIIMVKDLYDNTKSSLLNEMGEMVLEGIKSNPGSFHINEIKFKDDPEEEDDLVESQIRLETLIRRY